MDVRINRILKTFLLYQLQTTFVGLFAQTLFRECEITTRRETEYYMTDIKIIQLLINGIVETGEYTLEGIAYYSRIPYDVVLDAACGNTAELTITPWARIVDLYLQVKPEVSKMVLEKLAEITNRDQAAVSDILTDRLQ